MSSINRKAHCLKREKTLAIPRHLLFFDTETTQEKLPNGDTKQRLKLGWACYYRKGYGRNRPQTEWCNFNVASELWEFIHRHTQTKGKLWVLARNLVFDFTIVAGWKHLHQSNYKLKFFHSSGSTSIISVRNESNSIVFLDIMNWFVESLAATGERIGMPKLKIDFDNCTDEYLNIYCKRDVEIELENFKRFIKFLEDNSISRLCYTRGSTAMAAYLFSHYAKRIYIHNNKQAIDLERESYRGGRCECFYLGDLKNAVYYNVDVNSLYPFVMRNNLFPNKYLQISHKVTQDSLYSLLKVQSVTARVLIDTDEPVYAVRRKRCIFPVGRFWVTLCTPELKYAFERNHILKIGQAVVYEQANLFKSYVDRFYTLRRRFRESGNAEYEELCKKMLNSLYGKFGQKADVWKKIGDCPDEPDRIELLFYVGEHRVSQIRYLLGEVFELIGYEEPFNSFPAIAAHVTAYARLYLWELMSIAGQGNYFYCDTDSLIVNAEGLYNLSDCLDDSRLGGLKIVEESNDIIIRGLKDYSIGDKSVIKGIRRNAERISEGVYRQDCWPSFKGLLRSVSTEDYTVKRVTKQLRREYTKGTVNPDGVIRPFRFDDSDDVCPL